VKFNLDATKKGLPAPPGFELLVESSCNLKDDRIQQVIDMVETIFREHIVLKERDRIFRQLTGKFIDHGSVGRKADVAWIDTSQVSLSITTTPTAPASPGPEATVVRPVFIFDHLMQSCLLF
jgi:hypothetical protein